MMNSLQNNSIIAMSLTVHFVVQIDFNKIINNVLHNRSTCGKSYFILLFTFFLVTFKLHKIVCKNYNVDNQQVTTGHEMQCSC